MKKNNLETYGTIDKYHFDKRIFRLAFVLLAIILLIALNDQEWNFSNQIYIECPVEEPYCKNPFFGLTGEDCPDEMLCQIETFNGGDFVGNKPSHWFNTYLVITVLTIFIALIANHIAHNTLWRKQKK